MLVVLENNVLVVRNNNVLVVRDNNALVVRDDNVLVVRDNVLVVHSHSLNSLLKHLDMLCSCHSGTVYVALIQ